MPEGGDIAALAGALNGLLVGREIRVRWNSSPEIVTVATAVRSFGKRFFVDFRDRATLNEADSERRFEGHLGLKGSVWISRIGQPERAFLRHGNQARAQTVAEFDFRDDAGRDLRLSFRAGIGAHYEFKTLSSTEQVVDDAGVDLLGDRASLEAAWNRACLANPNRSVESILTDQTPIAGAGSRLRRAAFEATGLSGKEKSGRLTQEVRTKLILSLRAVAEEECQNCSRLLAQIVIEL